MEHVRTCPGSLSCCLQVCFYLYWLTGAATYVTPPAASRPLHAAGSVWPWLNDNGVCGLKRIPLWHVPRCSLLAWTQKGGFVVLSPMFLHLRLVKMAKWVWILLQRSSGYIEHCWAQHKCCLRPLSAEIPDFQPQNNHLVAVSEPFWCVWGMSWICSRPTPASPWTSFFCPQLLEWCTDEARISQIRLWNETSLKNVLILKLSWWNAEICRQTFT